MILKWQPDLLKFSLIILKFELYPQNFHGLAFPYFIHHSSAFCCLPYFLANSNFKDFTEKREEFREQLIYTIEIVLCHFVETFGLFFVHKVLLFAYEVSSYARQDLVRLSKYYLAPRAFLSFSLSPDCFLLPHLEP